MDTALEEKYEILKKNLKEMGSVLVAVTVGAALFRGVVATWLRRLVPYVHRMSSMFLIGAGVYLIYYWVVIAGSFG